MSALDVRINLMINNLPPEYRVPVVNALHLSDGTVLGFQQELAAQSWDNPGLPVMDIMDSICWDVA